MLYLAVLAAAVAAIWRSDAPELTAEARGVLAKPPPRRGHFLALAAGCVAFAAYGSLVPLRFKPLAFIDAWNEFRNLSVDIGSASRTDCAANVLLAVPIGFCGLAAIGCDRGRGIRYWCGAALVLLLSAMLSGGIELAQLWFPPRVASLNDIVAQILGALIGVSLWMMLGQRITDWLRGFAAGRDGAGRFVWLLQAYCVAFIIYSLMPLDLTIRPAEIWAKYKDGKIILVPFSGFNPDAAGIFALVTDTVLYGPIGAFAAVFGRGKREPRAAAPSFLIGMLLAIGIETGQLLVDSRFTDTTQLVTAAAGIILGASVMRWHWTRYEMPSARTAGGARYIPWRVASLVYSGFLLAYFWAPYDFASDSGDVAPRWESFFSQPFAALYWGTEFNFATQLVRKLFLFSVLGSLLIASFDSRSRFMGGRQSTRLAMLAFAFLLASMIEVGQLWLPDATPSFSDVVLYVWGTVAGMMLTINFTDTAGVYTDQYLRQDHPRFGKAGQPRSATLSVRN